MMDRRRVTEEIDKLRNFLDVELHPAVSPNRWDIYNTLWDMIDELEIVTLALLKEQEPVKVEKRIEETEWNVCSNCGGHLIHKWSYCPYCGRTVKWE